MFLYCKLYITIYILQTIYYRLYIIVSKGLYSRYVLLSFKIIKMKIDNQMERELETSISNVLVGFNEEEIKVNAQIAINILKIIGKLEDE